MTHLKSFFAALSFTLLLGSLNLSAQSNNRFVTFDFMKVKPGQAELYHEVEKKLWKPMHKQRMENGDILGWYFHQVRYPSGSLTEYDYVTVTLYDDITQLENQSSDFIALANQVHPDTPYDQIMFKTTRSRELIRTEVFQLLDFVPGNDSKPPPYMMVNYMKAMPGKAAEYVGIEQDIYKVWHSTRVEANRMHSWRLGARLLPYGSAYDYDHFTGDGYRSFADSGVNNNDLLPVFEAKMEAVENADISRMNRIAELRDLVRADLWALIDYIQVSAPAADLDEGN